jgi:hypothetical protein
MHAGPWSDRATWACGVRWVVSECGTVLLVAVTTAVTRSQPGILPDHRSGVRPTARSTESFHPDRAPPPPMGTGAHLSRVTPRPRRRSGQVAAACPCQAAPLRDDTTHRQAFDYWVLSEALHWLYELRGYRESQPQPKQDYRDRAARARPGCIIEGIVALCGVKVYDVTKEFQSCISAAVSERQPLPQRILVSWCEFMLVGRRSNVLGDSGSATKSKKPTPTTLATLPVR